MGFGVPESAFFLIGKVVVLASLEVGVVGPLLFIVGIVSELFLTFNSLS
jgi:hypothetical protein